MSSINKVNGKWKAEVSLTGFPRRSKTFISKSHAIIWSQELELKYEKNETYGGDRSLLTHKLSYLITRYQKTKSVFKKSYKSEVYVLKMLHETPLSDISVGAINSNMIVSEMNKIRGTLKPSTIRNRFAILRHIFNVAINEWGYPMTNPISKVSLPKSEETPLRRISEEELTMLRKILLLRESQKMHWIITFALETGLRRGEIVKLKWEDIDRSKNTARVSESKSGYVRHIPLSPKANECLESIPTQSEYVFDTTNSAIASAWKRLRKTAKVKRVRFHDFRHEAISRFFEKGLTIPEVMSISGHRTASMLFRYAHADQSKIAEKLAC
jgi:integrase